MNTAREATAAQETRQQFGEVGASAKEESPTMAVIPQIAVIEFYDHHQYYDEDLVRGLRLAIPEAVVSCFAPRRLTLADEPHIRNVLLPGRLCTRRSSRIRELQRLGEITSWIMRQHQWDTVLFTWTDPYFAAALSVLLPRSGSLLGFISHQPLQSGTKANVALRFSFRAHMARSRLRIFVHTEYEARALRPKLSYGSQNLFHLPFAPFDHRDRPDNNCPQGVLVAGVGSRPNSFAGVGEFLRQVAIASGNGIDGLQLTCTNASAAEALRVAGMRYQQRPPPESREEYVDLILEHRYVLIPYGERRRYIGSGLAHDALALGRPPIVPDMPVLRSTVTQCGLKAGELFGTVDELAAILKRIQDETYDDWLRRSWIARQHSMRLQSQFSNVARLYML